MIYSLMGLFLIVGSAEGAADFNITWAVLTAIGIALMMKGAKYDYLQNR